LILLDTHAWVWWVGSPEHLSPRARRALDKAATGEGLFVSSISTWEVALLVAKGRLRLSTPVASWIGASEALPFLRFVPVDNAIALLAVTLPGPLHDDPADRIIAATALSLGAELVTKDRRLIEYPHLRTLW
jgi:PIN domain nuclease of toxin-antitoxin system